MGGVFRQFEFVLGIEQALLGQFVLEREVGLLRGTRSSGFKVLGDKLKFAPAFVQGDTAAKPHAVAIIGLQANTLIAIAKHRAAHLGLAVLQGEIPVAGAWLCEITDFTLYPNVVKVALKEFSDSTIEL